MTEHRWDSLRSPEFQTRRSDRDIAIVPIGSTEQHGPHLPVMVDSRLAAEVAIRAAALATGDANVFVTPVLWVSLAEHHMVFPGTLTLDFDTFQAVLRCLVNSLARQGFKRILLLNGHGGNIAALSIIVDRLTHELGVPLVAATYWNVAATEFGAILDGQNNLLHACEAETSMMMFLHPERVDAIAAATVDAQTGGFGEVRGAQRSRTMDEISPSGVVGSPALATREKGAALLDAAARVLAERISDDSWWGDRRPVC
ncbi:creatininase family protein [Burkholderia cenocepacia]|uniref:creatininase family protein n=1 Tax=Burkholderia cenocepacia TaxID=95486 RepID=UPI0019060D24|nr:creatininase family protein [Burkholderia cenocepacia]MBJ9698548.1 creatininase family protein [Burkholderia cenocepacia]